MNWGLELSPKTNGLMASARSSPADVCRRVRKERESNGKNSTEVQRERSRGGEKWSGAKIKVLHSNLWEAFCNTVAPTINLLRTRSFRCVPHYQLWTEINAPGFDKAVSRHGQGPKKGTKVLSGLSFLTPTPPAKSIFVNWQQLCIVFGLHSRMW